MLLSHDDAAQYFRLMWNLQFYVNQQRKLLPDVRSVEEYARLGTQQKAAARDALWEHPDLIDAYIRANPDQLSVDELALISKWKGFVRGKFFIFRYLKDYAIFMSAEDSQIYGVKALYDPFDVVFQTRPLPILVSAVLLPYKGQIIYDGLLSTYSLFFGGGVRRDLKEQYMVAKQAGRIRTSLEAGAPEARPLSTEHKLAPESDKIAAEIAKSSERLRGGTAIQSAAFGVLRASAKLAEMAAVQPQESDELRRAARQVNRALNQLQRALDRALLTTM